MAASFFFYDLETSGFNPRSARVMQFAGQRADMSLKFVGEPVNVLVKMTPDVLPDPDAVLLTGITPQATITDGITEAEFLHQFEIEVATSGTIFVGYNTVRFDDEFMRFMHYRNFYDPYEWQWQDGRSKWDLLDVVRMTRALRPDGIQWPFDSKGSPTNRLELLTKLNKLDHAHAHDALSDVYATIEIARLIRNRQPKLFEYLLAMRDKKKVAELVEKAEPFVYASGQYPSEFEKTTVVQTVCNDPKKQGALVFDLRHDPAEFAGLSPEELAEAWAWKKPGEPGLRLPVKSLQYNHCPAIAPLGVLDEDTQKRLKIDLALVRKHAAALKKAKDFAGNLQKAAALMEKKAQLRFMSDVQDADGQLYDGFFENADRQKLRVVRAAQPTELGDLDLDFKDDRLRALLPLYKARNFPGALSTDERAEWEKFCSQKLVGGGVKSRTASYMKRLQELAAGKLTGNQQYLLEELQLYAESIMPAFDGREQQ